MNCDICGQACKKESYCDYEYALLNAAWGYDSNKDLEEHRCIMCEDCYDKVRAFIEKTLGGKIEITRYGG